MKSSKVDHGHDVGRTAQGLKLIDCGRKGVKNTAELMPSGTMFLELLYGEVHCNILINASMNNDAENVENDIIVMYTSAQLVLSASGPMSERERERE